MGDSRPPRSFRPFPRVSGPVLDEDEEQATAVFQIPTDLLASLRDVSSASSLVLEQGETALPLQAVVSSEAKRLGEAPLHADEDEEDTVLVLPINYEDHSEEPLEELLEAPSADFSEAPLEDSSEAPVEETPLSSFGMDVPSTPVVLGFALLLTGLVWALLTW